MLQAVDDRRVSPTKLREPQLRGLAEPHSVTLDFGPLPVEVENLLQVVALKQLCRSSGVERLEIGPKGRRVVAGAIDWPGLERGAKMIGVLTPDGAMLTDEGLKAHRAAYYLAIRDYHAQGKLAGKMAKWPLRFLIRHTAFHTLDHAWEMEDRDLTAPLHRQGEAP